MSLQSNIVQCGTTIEQTRQETSQDYVPSVINLLCSHTVDICVDLITWRALGELLEENFECAFRPSGEI